MPSSFHLPPSEFESRFGFPPLKKADPIVTHCGKGGRATKAAKALTGVVNLYFSSFLMVLTIRSVIFLPKKPEFPKFICLF